MKLHAVGILTTAVVMACAYPMATQRGRHRTGCTDVNWPALQPSDPAYRDAMDLARTIADNGFTVQCVAPSKMAGTFDGQAGAALYKTDRGSFEALFLPILRTFDGLQIVEREGSGRHSYSFTGYPKPWPANLIDASRRVYFIRNRNRLLVAQDKELGTQLKSILTGR
jgi:hypothetical protein